MLMISVVTRAADVVATWDFQHMAAGAVALQGTTGTVTSDVEGIVLDVDATQGKLQSRGSDAQFNTGTIIRVPVKSAKDSVYVTSYPKYHNYTVGGTAATEDVTGYKASSAEASQGYVEIVGTGSSYLYSIKVVQVSMIEEKLLYSTTFTDWTSAAAATTESTVAQSTKYSHEALNFAIFNTQISSTNQNTAKFPNWTGGYLMCSKSGDPYIITTPLASITKVHFLHGATGSNRGWMLEAKGDGDADWIVISSAVATVAQGTDVDVDINRTNCQLRFTNLNSSQNAYLFQLDIYGNVDMSKTPALGTFDVNDQTYHAADVFTENADGSNTGTIEISKAQAIISAANPLTNITTANGTVDTITYATTDNGTTATIPVIANGDTVNYIATFIYKPDYTLTYYNTDGTTVIGTQLVEKDAAISTFKYSATDANVADGSAFRGWFMAPNGSNNRKFDTTDVITANTALYALATEIETQSTTKRYSFRLTDQYFYDEDHEAFNLVGSGKFHDGTHGWQFAKGDSLHLLVGGNAYIVSQLCRYGSAATIKIVNSKGDSLATINTPSSTDGELSSYYYQGPADELTLVFNGAPYLHALTIVNVQDQPIARNEAGYYIVKAGDADNLLSTIEVANANAGDSRSYIFLPKGTYDLGETVLTPISGNNISIIGEDRDETIVVNAPKVANEGIGTTATFLITGQNTYFQDLTLKNALDYYASGSAGRAVVLQDKGNRTICKNVKMLSYQDTYYSNSDGQFYFEDGEIHGTVDYLCGSGDVYFNKVRLVNESRSATGKDGDDVIAAPYPGSTVKYGYVFNGCTIDNLAKDFSLGRSWGGESKLTYLNTIILQPYELIATRFTTAGMNVPAYQFKEYASVDSTGTIVTPVSNVQTFTKDKLSYTYNTTMSADSALLYSIDKVFSDWAPMTLAEQAVMGTLTLSGTTLSWDAVANAPAYAVFADGTFTGIVTGTTFTADPTVQTYSVKAANTMGGFGEAALTATATSINGLSTDNVVKTEYFSVNGMRLSQPQRGVNVRVNQLANGQKTTEKVIVK
ncbi:MAG: pectin esterase [Prevotella sp.]|nr:pectin esterase [Prevotella sp.]